MFSVFRIKKMDSYDEVHDVKDGRDIATPPVDLDLDVSSAIKFIHSEEEEKEDEKLSIEVKIWFS